VCCACGSARAVESLGAELATGTPQDFAEYIAREIPKWAKVVKDSVRAPSEVVVICSDFRGTENEDRDGLLLCALCTFTTGGAMAAEIRVLSAARSSRA